MSPRRTSSVPRALPVALGGRAQHLADAVEPGEGLAHLRADRGELDERRGQHAGERHVGAEGAERHAAVEDGGPADQDHEDADAAGDHARDRPDRRDAGHGARDVAEQPVRAAREDELLAALGGVGLDHAHAAQRLAQPPGDLGVDLAALAEERPQGAEGDGHAGAEDREEDQVQQRELPGDGEEPDQRDGRGDQAAGELHEPGADQVPHALGVGHDARDQHAGLGGVEVAHRQARDVGHHLLAHVGDGALRRHAEELREDEGGPGLDQGRRRRAPARSGAAARGGACRWRRRSRTWARRAARSRPRGSPASARSRPAAGRGAGAAGRGRRARPARSARASWSRTCRRVYCAGAARRSATARGRGRGSGRLRRRRRSPLRSLRRLRLDLGDLLRVVGEQVRLRQALHQRHPARLLREHLRGRAAAPPASRPFVYIETAAQNCSSTTSGASFIASS